MSKPDVDLRCPRDPARRFGVLRDWESKENAGRIEIACSECRRDLAKRGQRVRLVVHVFSADGTFQATEYTPDA